MPREITNRIIELVEEGVLTENQVMSACLQYMSEDAVEDMADANGWLEEFFED